MMHDILHELPCLNRTVAFLARRSSRDAWRAIAELFEAIVEGNEKAAGLVTAFDALAKPIQPFFVVHAVKRVVLTCGTVLRVSVAVDYDPLTESENLDLPISLPDELADVSAFEITFVLGGEDGAACEARIPKAIRLSDLVAIRFQHEEGREETQPHQASRFQEVENPGSQLLKNEEI